MQYVEKNKLKINSVLFEFINEEAIPGTNIKKDDFGKNLVVLFINSPLLIKN